MKVTKLKPGPPSTILAVAPELPMLSSFNPWIVLDALIVGFRLAKVPLVLLTVKCTGLEIEDSWN